YGRVVEKRGRNGTQHYRWDAEHRLTEVAVIRGSTVRRYGYVYDAPGRRVEKHELDAEGKPYNRTTFLWDGMRLAQECRLGRSSSLYIYSDQGSHEPLARVDRAAPGEADEVLYYHTDVNGAPEEMTDGGGNIVWEAGYQVWGNLTHEKETRPVQQNLRFQGQYLDRETGLHYNLYRFYDPDIGKFISGDPISIRGGINLYQYAPNPLSWIDPLGLSTTCLKAENGYSRGKRHGMKLHPNAAQAIADKENKPHGVWRSKDDLKYAGEQAATLKPGEMKDFPINPNSKSEVYIPGGNGVPIKPDKIRVRNNGDGTFHGFPIDSTTAGPIFEKGK
ncbi:RHS domain-containing protein, partial [Salmonella enterica]|nr:hypothetical protein [Salmonella enterica subsp. enterica serovar Hadar]EIS4272351.1 RHS domain-containing protein [Salmonella enterica]